MLELSVNLGERSYPIYIAQNNLTDSPNLSEFVRGQKVVIVSNETIAPIYLDQLTSQLPNNSFLSCIIPDGEQFKSLEYFEFINRFLLEHNCGRDTCLIALGGGVVGEVGAADGHGGVQLVHVDRTTTVVRRAVGERRIGNAQRAIGVLMERSTIAIEGAG